MRVTRSTAALVVGALCAATVSVVPSGAATEPVVTVTPSTELMDGQSVHVAISGATPSSESFTLLCATGSVEFAQCDERVYSGRTLDDDGAAEFDVGLDAEFGFVSGATVDCRSGDGTGCVLLTLLQDDGGAVVEIRTPVEFRPDGPLLPPPTIDVTPSTDLVDGTIAHVSGTGFVGGAGVTVVQCRTPFVGGNDCESPRTYTSADNAGALSVDVDLGAVLGTNDGASVDCRLVACVLVAARAVYESDPRHTTSAPLSFRPDGPLRPPPVLSVEPSAGLVDGQQVELTGSGFRPGNVVISQCGPGTGSGYERCPGYQSVFVDSTGELSATLPVAVLARVGSGYTDCRIAPGCSVAVRSDSGLQVVAEVPIAFDPAGPAPAFPSLSVAPGTELPARSPVIVAGHGFPAQGGLEVRQCRIEQGLPRECEQASLFQVADATGAFIAGTTVTAVIGGPDGTEIDCRTVTCALVADEYSQGLPGIAPLQFAPAPTKPRRYLAPVFEEVELTDGVAYRQATNSHGVTVDLTLDVYRPKGDTETRRPAVMWMFGGYFGSGTRQQLHDLASAMTRRGYVSIAIDYRTRPEIFSNGPDCVPVGGACLDPTQLGPAIADARDGRPGGDGLAARPRGRVRDRAERDQRRRLVGRCDHRTQPRGRRHR